VHLTKYLKNILMEGKYYELYYGVSGVPRRFLDEPKVSFNLNH
jgi:hypothetical protein